MSKNYYNILGVSKSATEAEIKKAYKKQAMQYHPDRNTGDKKAEAKFKEINGAYQILWDKTKKQNYDQFGSAEWNPFSGGNPFWWWGQSRSSGRQQWGGFEDIFSQFGGMGSDSWWIEFDIGDLFGWGHTRSQTEQREEVKKETLSLDITETVEIPFFDFLYDTSIDIRTVYGKHLTLKVKAGTKPGTKYKISGKGRSSEGKTGDMYVIMDAKMPREIPESLQPMIDALRSQL
jgi:DnaJ-class molecular chaperone